MARYTFIAPFYDLLSAEPVYRAGRRAAIADLGLSAGMRVLDLGCGTGLNLPMLHDAVGGSGVIVGVDRSESMLGVAAAKAARNHWQSARFVCSDAADVDVALADEPPFDALIVSYVLSLIPDWETVFSAAVSLVRDGGRISVVDMQLPTGRARILSPLARLACRIGGSDIAARPFTVVESAARDVIARDLRGGHVQVRTGTLRTGTVRT